MKVIEPKSISEASGVLAHLNFCHDASLRKLCFVKRRDVSAVDGSLTYPFSDTARMTDCDIEVELIHNNYEGAARDQIVLLTFRDCDSFAFRQDRGFDYSEVYEVAVTAGSAEVLSFRFYATSKRTEFLALSCRSFLCTEA